MKILEYKKIEGCLEGSNVWDALLDRAITESDAEAFSALGKLYLFKDMDKPYYKLIVRGSYIIKGSVGNRTVRFYLPEDSTLDITANFRELAEELPD